MPVWQLDGSRGFAALTRLQRGLAVAVVVAVWWHTREGLLLLVALLGLFRVFGTDVPDEEDWTALLVYAGLVVMLSLLCSISVPI